MGVHHAEEDHVLQSFVQDVDDTSSLYLLGSLPSGALLVGLIVVVSTVFVGAADAELGTVVVNDQFLGAGVVDLKTLGMRTTELGIILAGPTELALNIQGGSGGGDARIIVQYIV